MQQFFFFFFPITPITKQYLSLYKRIKQNGYVCSIPSSRLLLFSSLFLSLLRVNLTLSAKKGNHFDLIGKQFTPIESTSLGHIDSTKARSPSNKEERGQRKNISWTRSLPFPPPLLPPLPCSETCFSRCPRELSEEENKKGGEGRAEKEGHRERRRSPSCLLLSLELSRRFSLSAAT